MHDHDPDLIAAVAEQTLGGAIGGAAAAEVTACPRCSAELELQRSALDALRSLPAAAMTPAEAAGVRAGVAAALGIAPAVDPAPRRSKARWTAVTAAAALAGALAFVPVLGLFSGGEDAAPPAMEATAFESKEGTVVPTDDGSPVDSASLPENADQPADAVPPGDAGDLTAPPEEVIAAGATPEALVGNASLSDLLAAGPEAAAWTAEDRSRMALQCADAAESALGLGFIALNAPAFLDDGREVVVYLDGDWSALVALDPADCSTALRLP
jgi:hypothetical protein